MICPNCGDIELIDRVCPKCKCKMKPRMDIYDLSSERPLRNRGEAEAVVAELRRVIRMMKVENTYDYSEGFFPFMKIREDKLLRRIKEVKQETEKI